jgi:hypothetical protein
MVVGQKKHSKKYYDAIARAKSQIKLAEEGMKMMDKEVKEFHNHMATSMASLMKTFNEGFNQLDQAKKDEKDIEATQLEVNSTEIDTKEEV